MLLFLGAGASSPFGIPTMPGFVKLFDQEVSDSQIYLSIKESFGEDFDLEVLMTVIEDLSKSPQEFFRAISPQTAHFLLQKEREQANHYLHEDSRKEALQLLVRIKAIIRRECIKAVSDDTKILGAYNDFFNILETERMQMTDYWGQFQEGRGQQKTILPVLRIFTTNYDTCVEVYFNRKEIDFSRGIVKKYGEDIFDVDSYESPPEKNIKIFKLHGSIDLFQKSGKIRQLDVAGPEKTFLGEECGEESMRWPIEFGGYRHVIESPYLDLFRLFRQAAKQDSWWIIIGFSFRDRTICSILDDVLRLKPVRERPHVLIINRHTQPVSKRLKEWGYYTLAESIWPVEAEFGSKDLPTKLHEAFVAKGLIKGTLVLTGKRP